MPGYVILLGLSKEFEPLQFEIEGSLAAVATHVSCRNESDRGARAGTIFPKAH